MSVLNTKLVVGCFAFDYYDKVTARTSVVGAASDLHGCRPLHGKVDRHKRPAIEGKRGAEQALQRCSISHKKLLCSDECKNQNREQKENTHVSISVISSSSTSKQSSMTMMTMKHCLQRIFLQSMHSFVTKQLALNKKSWRFKSTIKSISQSRTSSGMKWSLWHCNQLLIQQMLTS